MHERACPAEWFVVNSLAQYMAGRSHVTPKLDYRMPYSVQLGGFLSGYSGRLLAQHEARTGVRDNLGLLTSRLIHMALSREDWSVMGENAGDLGKSRCQRSEADGQAVSLLQFLDRSCCHYLTNALER